jgi:hypothetical protein
MGLCAHVQLSRISNYIVCETLGIASQNTSPRQLATTTNEALKRLQEWKSQLPSSLQMPDDHSNADASCWMLHMEHNHLIVLITHPIFFTSVKQAAAPQVALGAYLSPQFPDATQVSACLAAAYDNLILGNCIKSSGRKLLQAGLHFVFHAAVILLSENFMRSIRPRESDASRNLTMFSDAGIEANIRFAIETFEEEAKTGTRYTRENCRVLQSLNALTRSTRPGRLETSRNPTIFNE